MPYKTLCRRISAVATAGGFLALALAPASSNAAVIPFGSDLAAPANLVEARQADTAYWQTTFADGRSPVVQADGQIRSVQIKGIALANPVEGVPGGETMFHVQVMAPRADGTFQIRNPGGTSGAFYLPPRSANPQAITTYQPENLCVRAGDVVVFNTVGGWDGISDQTGPYRGGTPLQIFSRVPGAMVSEFMSANMTNNGDIVTPKPLPSHELLMRVTLGTAEHATALCPGGLIGAAPPPPPSQSQSPAALAAAPRIQKATLPAGQKVTVSKKGKLSVSLFCLPGSSRCAGTLRVMTRGSKPKSLGSGRFAIAPKRTGHATIFLNRTGRRLFARAKGKLGVKLVAETRPGGASRRSTLSTTLRRRGG